MIWPIPWKLTLALVLAASLAMGLFFWAGRIRADEHAKVVAEYTAKILAQKAEASQVLAAETAKVLAAEHTMQDFKTKLETKDAANTKTIAGLSGQLHAALQLRDPKAARCWTGGDPTKGGDPTTTSTGPADSTETGGLLSADLAGLLQRITSEADTINAAYASCSAWVTELTRPGDPVNPANPATPAGIRRIPGML